MLVPYIRRAGSAEVKAAKELLRLVDGYAWPGQNVAVGSSYADAEVFVSHRIEDASIAEALSGALRKHNLKVQTSADVLDSAVPKATLEQILSGVRLCVVIVGRGSKSAEAGGATAWSQMQSAAWTRSELLLMPLLVGGVACPAFLRDERVIRLARSWQSNLPRAVKQILASLRPTRKGAK